ncbi:MAG: GAF domain-containing protein, partial [Acidimicrobiales bacterium]
MEATFRRLAEMAAKAPEPSPLYQHLLAAFVDAVSADQAALALFDGDGVMRVAATHEIGADVAGGRCGWPTVADTAGTRAIAIVPLLVGGEVLGTLTAFFDRPRPVSETELGVARDLAAQGAAEIHRQRLEAGLGLANLALTAILDAAPDGITVQGPDGRLVFANQDAAALIGFGSPGELLAATPAEILARFELFDEDGVRMTRTELPGRRALQGEYPPDHLVRWRLVGADGSDDRWSLVSARPVFGEDGAVRFAVNVFRDVTERQRAAEALRRSERRLGFLAATSPRLLDSALDYAGVLDGVARLFVPDLADVCSVRELDADGMSRRVATTYSDAVEAAVAEHLDGLDRSPAAQLLDDLAARLPVLAPDVALLPDPRLGRALSRLGVQSAIAVPLRAGPTWLGDVTLLSMVEGRRYDEADLALVEEVARRAGLTAQNARLFQEQRSVASTLQRA